MGLFDRLGSSNRSSTDRSESPPQGQVTVAHLYSGEDDLEVVGESNYQDALWAICSGTLGDRIRHEVVAVLVPDRDNVYDPNAISIHIDGHVVGYLPRAVAAQYRPGLERLMRELDGYVALRAVIVGGGYYEDGPGRLGVWLEHDPADFGRTPGSQARRVAPGVRPGSDGTMRTGFTEAWITDLQDDSYDLSWFNDLPEADRPAIAILRDLLAHDPDPIDRHFQFTELERRLYRCRELYDAALEEFDAACEAHDAEMDAICEAFRIKWGKIPQLETYRQMAIRQQKKKDWDGCRRWAERGLDLYGSSAARDDAVEDLLKRRNRATAKIEEVARKRGAKRETEAGRVVSAATSQFDPENVSSERARRALNRRRSSDPLGHTRGRHYTEHVETVKQLKREGRLDEAEALLLDCCDAVEAEAQHNGWVLAPWYYDQLGIVYRKLKDHEADLAIQHRFRTTAGVPRQV